MARDTNITVRKELGNCVINAQIAKTGSELVTLVNRKGAWFNDTNRQNLPISKEQAQNLLVFLKSCSKSWIVKRPRY